MGISNSSIGSENVKLFSSISDATRWKFYITCDGQLFIESKNAVGKSIYSPNSTSGTKLQLEFISSPVTDRTKWIFGIYDRGTKEKIIFL